ncbi:MAG: CapA family protein [Bauldia sp.]|nr:MAG: CapA family protein [Bauldia sp.]
MRPAGCARRRIRARLVTDLPDPDSPTSPSVRPGRRSKATSETARTVRRRDAKSTASPRTDSTASAGIVAAGAGRDAETAWRPAILPAPGGRLLVFAVGCASAGVPASWAADPQRPGVARIGEADDESARRIARHVESWRKPGDTVVVSIHWGGNWGYAIPGEHRRFATILAAEAGVDIVHGHSSHHPIALETVDGRPVLYGCGDFINDYEGISGYEAYRPDLSLAYVIDIGDGPTRVTMVPFRMRRFRLERATAADAKWLAQRLDRECRRLGSRIALDGDGCLVLQA